MNKGIWICYWRGFGFKYIEWEDFVFSFGVFMGEFGRDDIFSENIFLLLFLGCLWIVVIVTVIVRMSLRSMGLILSKKEAVVVLKRRGF